MTASFKPLDDHKHLFSDAKWLSAPWMGGPRSCPAVPYFRKGFTVPSEIRAASLVVTAFGVYEIEVNGKNIADDVFAPGWTDYRKRVQYQRYDVTDFVMQGPNMLGLVLGDGWYCGHVAWQDRQVYGRKPWFLALLSIELTNGEILSIPTDESWVVRSGPILESDMVMGEVFDARLKLPDWSMPRSDGRGWEPVEVGSPNSGCKIVPRSGPGVRRIAELVPLSVRSYPDGECSKLLVCDFGQNFSGRIKIVVRARSGANVRLRYAEVLTASGDVYTDNLRSARATDYYTCAGTEEEIWEPAFTFHGFRYVEVTGLAESDHFEIVGIVLHSDMPLTGSFACSHPLLNQLQSNILWGQKSNFLEVPTDCPQRDERLGWTGDAQVFVRTAAFNMDVRAFFSKWLGDIVDAQNENGAIPVVAPMPGFFRHIPHVDGGPAWSDAMIICPWTIYLCYADTEILRDNYEAMKKFMSFIANHRCKNFIRSHPDVDAWGGFGDWLALDGSGRLDGNTPKDLIGTAFYAYNAEIMSRVAYVLGHHDDAEMYERLHECVKVAFQRRFVSPDGFVISRTQTAYVLALHFKLVPGELVHAYAEELVRMIEANGTHLATGFVGTPYILDVLTDTGHLDVAYRLLEQETSPSWLFPVKNGATTIWERWNGWTPDQGFEDKAMNSFNHYAYGAVGAWMYGTVAGLNPDPSHPGYERIIFKPRPGGTLTFAEASLVTKFGLARIRWERFDGSLLIDLEVPKGCEAALALPAEFGGQTEFLGCGRHRRSFSETTTSGLLTDNSFEDWAREGVPPEKVVQINGAYEAR